MSLTAASGGHNAATWEASQAKVKDAVLEPVAELLASRWSAAGTLGGVNYAPVILVARGELAGLAHSLPRLPATSSLCSAAIVGVASRLYDIEVGIHRGVLSGLAFTSLLLFQRRCRTLLGAGVRQAPPLAR